MTSTQIVAAVSTSLLLIAELALAVGPRTQAIHAFAQGLVEQLHSAHPEFSEIGISAVIPGAGCKGIASTDKTDIGETCESDDAAPIKTGRASISAEGKNLDISLPLHDAAGKLVGAIAIEVPPGASRAETVRRVRAAVRGIESQIPSKARLIS